jgi:hypothetical protein
MAMRDDVSRSDIDIELQVVKGVRTCPIIAGLSPEHQHRLSLYLLIGLI